VQATAIYNRGLDRIRHDALRAAGYRGPAYLQGRPAYEYAAHVADPGGGADEVT
jgi:hypothetical protein